MRLRAAVAADAAPLAAISIEVWTGTYLRRGVGPVFADHVLSTYTPDAVASWIAEPEAAVIVAEAEEGPVGYVRIAPNRPGPFEGCGDTEIVTLYVQPRHHGAGIGAALLRAGIEAIGPTEAVWLTTNSENSPAIGFYGAMGFAQVGTTDYVIDGVGYPNHVFAKRP